MDEEDAHTPEDDYIAMGRSSDVDGLPHGTFSNSPATPNADRPEKRVC